MKAALLALLFTFQPALAFPAKPAPEKELQLIRKKYKRWESEREDLKKSELSRASQPASEGSKAYVYRKNGKVLIIDESYFADMGQATWSYYFDSGHLFFILESETHYAYPITVNAEERKKLGGGEDKTTENRYYFKQGKLIRWLEGRRIVPVRGEKFREQSKSVHELATLAYKNALTTSAKPK
jgi:hypothetical protein